MARLIVHGDDCGLTPRITDGILAAHRRGILTSASVSACGADFDRTAALLRDEPSLDCGIHLTLVEERPLLDPAAVPTLVDGAGRFHRHAAALTRRYLTRRLALREVGAELEAQILRVIDHGLKPSHVDSHDHVHLLPGVLDIVLGLARKYGIRALRLPRRMVPTSGHVLRHGIRGLQLLVLDRLARQAGAVELARTDGFNGFLHGGRLTESHLLDILGTLPAHGTFELMCHPGLADPESPYRHWRYQWDLELEALTSPEVRALVTRRGIDLVGFRDLDAISCPA